MFADASTGKESAMVQAHAVTDVRSGETAAVVVLVLVLQEQILLNVTETRMLTKTNSSECHIYLVNFKSCVFLCLLNYKKFTFFQ